ncbi:hypothetical protein [Nocardioides renjunii]|uniref:hypothetical protein n=1 Tax=Nocardioides renjunii TaxID=3095075 RepID=UPI002AFE9393|nr:hypothetical protein [Nocardioides sp. S-34]WQQ21778.1 hypothetical protein SHK17_18020 [Nocardioides sp. S-34]
MADTGTTPTLSTSRRALVRGAAWSVPVVTMAATAPAFAASPCSDRYTYQLNWGTTPYSRTSFRASSATVSSLDSSAVTVSFASVSYSNDVVNNTTTSNNRPDQTRNLTVPANTGTGTTQDPVVTSLGGRQGERGVMLYHAASTPGRGNRQEVTITFSRPVRGLSFYVTDIDTITNPAYSDRVEVLARTGTGAIVGFANVKDGVTGNGVNGDPWLRAGDSNVGENAGGAQVQVNFPTTTTGAADVKTVTITYWNNSGGTQYHRVFLGDLNFTAIGC